MHPDDIRDLLQLAVSAAASGDTAFVAEATLDPDGWMQITWDTVNLSYATDRDPAEFLVHLRLPDFVELSTWEANSYVTFEHGADDLDRIADFIAAFITAVAEAGL